MEKSALSSSHLSETTFIFGLCAAGKFSEEMRVWDSAALCWIVPTHRQAEIPTHIAKSSIPAVVRVQPQASAANVAVSARSSTFWHLHISSSVAKTCMKCFLVKNIQLLLIL